MSVIAIVGMPGSGKTTVGRHLARRLGLRFIDTDHELERELGCSVKQYFEIHGEDSFRDAEAAVIARLCTQGTQNAADGSGVVLATGGGAVLRQRLQVLQGLILSMFYQQYNRFSCYVG